MKNVITAAMIAFLASGAAHASTISFDSLTHSEEVTSVTTDDGRFSADVSATGGADAAFAFDTTLTGTLDPDLEGPFERFSDTSQLLDAGSILIVQESLVSDADDNATGGSITFTFSEAVNFTGFTLIDDASISVSSSSIAASFDVSLPAPAADGYFELFETGDLFSNVTDLTFTFDGSGGIDDLRLAALPLPAGLPMLLVGLAGFGLLSRRHRKAA